MVVAVPWGERDLLRAVDGDLLPSYTHDPSLPQDYPKTLSDCSVPASLALSQGVEVQKTRVEGSMIIVEARLSVNLTAMTIEQVIAKVCRNGWNIRSSQRSVMR